jgi:hypothetical protein
VADISKAITRHKFQLAALQQELHHIINVKEEELRYLASCSDALTTQLISSLQIAL